MKPIYTKEYLDGSDELFEDLKSGSFWVNRDAPRDECFMALNNLEYTYGEKMPRTYKSVDMIDSVKSIMERLNKDFECDYNVCFLNYYADEKKHLGWHSDDSPEMDAEHPIAVVSVGAERAIWYKPMGFKGNIPNENKISLASGSLFVMPVGFQDVNLHRIPKHDRPCGGRISLTFRRYKY